MFRLPGVKALATGLFLLIPGLVFAQNPRFISVTDTSAVNPNEVSVSINPVNPDHIVAVSMQFRSGISNMSYSSTNGGLTWNERPHPNPQKRVQGDDAVVFTPSGLAVHSYISFDGIRSKRPKKARNGIFVTTSTDGLSWSEPVPAIDHLNTVRPFEDKPWPSVDAGPDSPGKGRIMLSWTRFDEYQSSLPGDSTNIYFTASDDSGKSFRPPFRINDVAGTCLDDGNTVEGAVSAAGPDGTIFVAWSGPQGIMIDKSTDGGWTFGKDVKVADHIGGWSFAAKNIERHNGMPVLRADISKGPNRGTLYLTFLDKRNGDPDVFLVSSRDGGQTWTVPARVNGDKIRNGVDQLFVWLAVDPVDGSLNFVYYDRSHDEKALVGVTYSRSVDGGKTFKHFKDAAPPFEFNPDLFFGDYIGIDAFGGRTVYVFTHQRTREKLALRAGIYDFEPGTHRLRKN